jgi:hypothetical protein
MPACAGMTSFPRKRESSLEAVRRRRQQEFPYMQRKSALEISLTPFTPSLLLLLLAIRYKPEATGDKWKENIEALDHFGAHRSYKEPLSIIEAVRT